MPAFETRDLAIYAAIIGTLDGAWSLYQGAFLDRPRLTLRIAEAEIINPISQQRIPVLSVVVSNRGRRTVEVSHISRVVSAWRRRHELSGDIAQQLVPKPALAESRSLTFTHGHAGGYQHGQIPLRRWFVQDGAGRIHPLRERYRQRVERAVFGSLRRLVAVWSRLSPSSGSS